MIEIKNILKELLEKNCKIHPKTLQKNNNDITSDNIDNNIKIIKSNDNNFIVDINKNFMTFYDKTIKFFYYNDQIYFKGIDIALMLDYCDTDQAIQNNVDNRDTFIFSKLLEDPVSQTGCIPIGSVLETEDPKTLYINESGFYSFIFASKKQDALEFRRWITSEVLPSIRKTCSYNITDNYIEEDLDKYYNKDCVYIIHIKDNIYKYGQNKIIENNFILNTKQKNFFCFVLR